MSKQSTQTMKKLIGVQCRECKKYFKDATYLIGHEQSVHGKFPPGYGFAASGFIASSNIQQSTNTMNPFPTNPPMVTNTDDGFDYGTKEKQ